MTPSAPTAALDAAVMPRQLPPHLAALLTGQEPQTAAHTAAASEPRPASAQAAARDRADRARARLDAAQAELDAARVEASDTFAATFTLDQVLAVDGPIQVAVEHLPGENADILTLRWSQRPDGRPDKELTDPDDPVEGLDTRLAATIEAFNASGITFIASHPDQVREWVEDACGVPFERLEGTFAS